MNTFNAIVLELLSVEKYFNIKLDTGESIPYAPIINPSLCSCKDHVYKISDFKITDQHDSCTICRNSLDGEFIQSLVCNHTFHYSCIVGWHKLRENCPLCNREWKYVSEKTIVQFGDTVSEVDDISNYSYDNIKYRLIKNMNLYYSICTPDMHPNKVEINLIFGNRSQKITMNYSDTVTDLRQEICRNFGIFKEEIKLNFPNTATLYNIGIVEDSVFIVEIRNDMQYSITIDDGFLTLFIKTPPTGSTIQEVTSGRVSWNPFPFIPQVSNSDLSCLLSSLYLLIKKVNAKQDAIGFVVNKFEKYCTLYNIQQVALAKGALASLLKMEITDKNRMIISNTFHELISKMKKISLCKDDKVLSESNILCSLLLSLDNAEIINWNFAKRDMKGFTIYSPLVLNKSVPPLLTMNSSKEVVVYIGKSKDLSLSTILYCPLINDEVNVNAEELGKELGINSILVDDRIYDEAIMVCIDTSGSMHNRSDFDENEKVDHYKLWNTPEGEVSTRELKNTIIWCIIHPNFKDWKPSRLKEIVSLEQSLPMAKYRDLFLLLLTNKKVTLDNETYSYNNEELIDIPYDYTCPISRELMIDPVIAMDGFTYERKYIEKWFGKESRISPMTGEKLLSCNLISNKSLKSIINNWSDNKGSYNVEITDGNSTYKYSNNGGNVWDVKYFLFQKKGLTSNQYTLNVPDDVDLNQLRTIRLTRSTIEKYELTIESEYETSHLTIPTTFNIKNIIYSYDKYAYDKCTFWFGLKETGDGVSCGHLFNDIDIVYKKINEYKITVFNKRREKKNYLSRLDVVKKLFDTFINRSIAYFFNTAIGLIEFNDKANCICEITPFYESFRENIDKLDAKGNTALYESLNDAVEKLVFWKGSDTGKRSKAKLRIICLSDGKDTGNGGKEKLVKSLLKHNIILDCIVIGNCYDDYLSKIKGGYLFNPTTIKYALNIMELETMILSKNRKVSNSIIKDSLPGMIKPETSLRMTAKKIDTVSVSNLDAIPLIQKQLVGLLKNPHPDIDIYINDDDLTFWKLVFKGPDGTPYQKGYWIAYMSFGKDYPDVPPNIRFVTEIKHCNINNYGRVCHSILDRNYVSTTSIELILQCIYGLLLNPDISDPLDTNLALLYYEANGQYEAMIMEHTERYALKTRDL